MTHKTHFQNLALVWTLCMVLTTTTGDEALCPEGGQIHLTSMRCYWLSETPLSWTEAQDLCRETQGGDLAVVDSPEKQNFIHYSFPVEASVWLWCRGAGEGDHPKSGGKGPTTPHWPDNGSENQAPGDCAQMALGTMGQQRRSRCAGEYAFLCEKQVTMALPSVDSYLTGVSLMSGVYAKDRLLTLPSAPDTRQHTVEMQLFPGLWFSHAGRLVSVELVVQPSPLSTLSRIQILRPYCSPSHHLVPPGCSSLLNPFTCCSAVPLCNTTGGCSTGQYWCHLLEACVPVTSPCSPYPYSPVAGERSFSLPPRFSAITPFYHLVADLPLRVNPSSQLKTIHLVLPDREITVYPDDVLAVQHTRESGTFLHCRGNGSTLNSPWRQSYLSLRGSEWGGWMEGGLSPVPRGGQWIDDVVCDLQTLYVDTLHRAIHDLSTEHMIPAGFTRPQTTTVPDVGVLQTTAPAPGALTPVTGLRIIHPKPDENNQIHVQIDVQTLIVVKILSGQRARSSWSAPVLRTGVPLLPSCPGDVAPSWPGCERESPDVWFSSAALVLTSVRVETLDISVVNGVSAQSASVKVCGYEPVSGLHVEPYGHQRVLVDTSQVFTAKVEGGSSVRVTWAIDNLEEFAYEGETYTVLLNKPAAYNLLVTASNPVSSQTQEIRVTAEVATPLSEPEFLSVSEVVDVAATRLYTVRLKVDISLGVTVSWDFGETGSQVNHSHPAPCQTTEGLVDRGERQVYVQDTVSHSYHAPGEYTLQVQISNTYDSTEASMKIKALHPLRHLLISSSSPVARVNQTLLFDASAEPSPYGAVFTWNFGDGSKAAHGPHRQVTHAFRHVGVYNVTVSADNSVTALAAWLTVDVMEGVTGLTVSHSGPSELNSVTEIIGQVTTGSSLIWDFDFGDGSRQANRSDRVALHTFRSQGTYVVDVTASNSVSKAHQLISVEVYTLTITGILPSECVRSGRETQLSAQVNGNISALAFRWSFGDGSPLSVVRGNPTAVHSFQTHGSFNVNLTVLSIITSTTYNVSVCVEAPISDLTVRPSKVAVAVGELVCFSALAYPEQTTGYQFMWFNSLCSHTPSPGNSQKCLVYEEDGVKDVTVVASNQVSNRTANATVAIQRPVSNLSMAHDGQSDTLTANTMTSFWLASCTGTNVSVLWDFGDGSPVEEKRNASHVFTSPGPFTLTATAYNAVSRDSVTLKVNVFHPVSDLTLHVKQPYAVAGEETVITALSSAISSTNYYWSVDGVMTTKQGMYQFRYVFPKPGAYHVRVIAQNVVSNREAAILVRVFERIEGLHIECQSLIDMKYIETGKSVRFVASLSRGSYVTYHWLATQTRATDNHTSAGDGELFQILVESPGCISIQLTATNQLGEISSYISVVAVERATGANIVTRTDTVAAGQAVNISVIVVTGSNLRYLWYVNSDPSPLQTEVPFLLHTFMTPGHCPVKVSVQNVLSHSDVTKQFVVQGEVEGIAFQIDRNAHPFFVNTSAPVTLHGLIHEGSDLKCDWKVDKSAKHTLFIGTGRSLIYTFTEAGVYKVSLNVSNGISWQTVSHSVTAQDAIKGLTLNISKSPLCTEEQVIFSPIISKGSNVSFVISFGKLDPTHRQDIVEGHFITSSLPAGTHLVTVNAWNQVSSSQVTSSILVAERIVGLQLVDCCSTALEAGKEVTFKSDVQRGLPVTYNWTFHLEGSEPSWAGGQEVSFSSPGGGALTVSVVASNGVCSQTLKETATVQWPVKEVTVVCQSLEIFTGHAVHFSAQVNGGSSLKFLWDFGDSAEVVVTDLNSAIHTYHVAGRYSVGVQVFNNVSQASTRQHVEVKELQCSLPNASLVQGQSTIFRTRPSFFEATVDVNDCSAYKTTYRWEILAGSDCTDSESDADFTGNTVSLSSEVDVSSPLLFLPKHALETGQYCTIFTMQYQGTPLFVRRKINVTVVHCPLVAIIKGGSHRLWPSLCDLFLDGSESHDPDVEPGVEDQLQYHWTVMTENSTESQSFSQTIRSNSSSLTVLSTELDRGRVYVFTLTVHKAGRTPVSTVQSVSLSDAPVLPVSVACVSCSALNPARHVSYSAPIVLSGRCEQCDEHAQYKWSAREDKSGVTLDLNEVTTSTGGHSPDMAVRPGVLQDGRGYTFTLDVTQPGGAGGQWGSASLSLLPNRPPYGGRCSLEPESDAIRPLETVVTYNCTGWQDEDSESSQLIYTFQVAPCKATGTACPRHTLYRGTRSAFGTLVPVGSPGPEQHMSFITVTLLVEDHLGAKVIALDRMLTVAVLPPTSGEVTSQWLRNSSQTELWLLLQRGPNPQELIPYAIALTSQLNMESAGSVGELRDRREIRGNVTRALASLPVSSLQDVDQISSALAQSTAVASEVVCEGCHEKVLEAVAKMIHVMEEQTSAGVAAAVDTGRNILDVLGSTLAAAASEPPGGDGHHHSAFTSTPRPATESAQSAVAHAGALMRSLMRSSVRGEEPLSLVNSRISAVGFRGNPSDLLCSAQNSSPKRAVRYRPTPSPSSPAEAPETPVCPFFIPVPLAAQLKRQSSEVVQILVGVEGIAETNDALRTGSDPPISTALAAMEFSTPWGRPIPVNDLDSDRAIRVTLPNRHLLSAAAVAFGGAGYRSGSEVWNQSADRGVDGNGASPLGLNLTLPPSEGWTNFTVEAVDGLADNAGLFVALKFSVAQGAIPLTSGRVRIEVTPIQTDPASSQGSLIIRELTLSLPDQSSFKEETIFLSPLLKGTGRRLSVSLSSSLGAGGPVRASVCVFSSLCQYYNVTEGRWSSGGVRPLEGSTLRSAHCLTRHLSTFGASLFVHPGAVVLLPPAGGPVRNMVVGMVCAVLVLMHLLLGLIAHKLDHLEGLGRAQVPLCGPPGLYHYRVLVKTGWRRGAGTSAHVGINLYGVTKSGPRHLQRDGAFQRGGLDQFHLETDDSLGEVWKIRLWHDNTGLDPSWFVQQVAVWDPQTDHMFFFTVEDWLSVEDNKNGTVEKFVLASCPEELSDFRRVLSCQLAFGLAAERHLWLSLWLRPSHSRFTRAQRVTCGAVLLHLYLAAGALWYGAVGSEGHSGTVSDQLLVTEETVAVGTTVAVLVFPLRCLLSFLFRKTQSQVTADVSVPPSPVCHSVEMDVYLGQSDLSGPSFLSLPDSSGLEQESPSSLVGSKGLDSEILEFWKASGLAPQSEDEPDGEHHHHRGTAVVGSSWPSCDSLLKLDPSDPGPTDSHTDPPRDGALSLGPARLLKRRKALMQLRLASSPFSALHPDSATRPVPAASSGGGPRQSAGRPPSSASAAAVPSSTASCAGPHESTYRPLWSECSDAVPRCASPGQAFPTATPHKLCTRNLTTTVLTQSEEDLLRSIAAEADIAETSRSASTSDSGRYSHRSTSSLSNTQSSSCSRWSEQSMDDEPLYGAEFHKPACPPPTSSSSSSSLCGTGLYKWPSSLSISSVASTYLPSPSPDPIRSPSATRIGVARGRPGWLLPPWAVCVVYPLVAVLLGLCLTAVGLYGRLFSRAVVLMWLISALSAFLTSALLLEPLKVFVQALFSAVLWRPVDQEVEDLLAQQETTVRRAAQEEARGAREVHPPCGYGLLQAKQEARKLRALRSLMKHCVSQLCFLLLMLMVNYQGFVEDRQGRLLHSAFRRSLHTAPSSGTPNLTCLNRWSDAWQWMGQTLVPHLHQNPALRLSGAPRLRYTSSLTEGPQTVFLGNSSEMTHRVLAGLNVTDGTETRLKTLSVDFTHYHRESTLFVCVSVRLERAQTHAVISSSLSIRPLFIPPSSSGPTLQSALAVLLLLSALVLLVGELRAVASERAQYARQGWHWFQLVLASLSLVTASLQLCFLSQASSCVLQVRSHPESFVDFHSASRLAVTSSQLAALILALLILKLLGTLRFVRRWVVIGTALQRAWRELWGVVVLLLLMLALCSHGGTMLFSGSVDGFRTVPQAGLSVLSLLRGRAVLRGLCRAHPVLGPLYGLLLMGGGLWLMIRLCGAILFRAYRAVQADLYRPTMEPQDYEMVEFFMKRLKLWMGLTKAKEFRHRVKFEGMEASSSRSSRESQLCTTTSSLTSSRSPSLSSPCLSCSPRPASSALSVTSEDSSASESAFDVQPYLDRLLPCVGGLLSRFDRVNQITEDLYALEVKLEEVQSRRRRTIRWDGVPGKGGGGGGKAEMTQEMDRGQGVFRETGEREAGELYPRPRISLPSSVLFSPTSLNSLPPAAVSLFPRARSSYSESTCLPPQSSKVTHRPEDDKPAPVSFGPGMCPAGAPGSERFPRRRAWHSGSSHSADVAQRGAQGPGRAVGCGDGDIEALINARPRSEEGRRRLVGEGVPVKRSAWTSDGPETDQGWDKETANEYKL